MRLIKGIVGAFVGAAVIGLTGAAIVLPHAMWLALVAIILVGTMAHHFS